MSAIFGFQGYACYVTSEITVDQKVVSVLLFDATHRVKALWTSIVCYVLYYEYNVLRLIPLAHMFEHRSPRNQWL